MPTPSATPKLGERLQALWDLRNAGAVDSALAGWLAWCGELGLASDASVEQQAGALGRQGLPAREILRFSLLGMSFLRNARRLPEMRERAAAIQAWARAANEHRSFTLSLQWGLNAMAEGNLAFALENFTEARRLAEDRKSLLFSLINATICCEDLGLDFSRPLAEFEAAFAGNEKEPWAQSLLGQLEALRLRQAFKRGDGAALKKLAQGSLAAEQAHYYAAWLASIPTFRLASDGGTSLRESFLTRVEESGFTYQSGFRLRTLNFLLVKEDLEPTIRTGEKIERLYLWVWQWLKNPDASLLERTLRVKQNLELDRAQQIGFEQYQLLRLSLRWLGLFSGLSEDDLAGSLRAWRSPLGTALPHLEYESTIQDWLFALRNRSPLAADQRKMLALLPARRLPGFSLPSLLQESPEETLRSLAESAAKLGADGDTAQQGLLVEQLNGRVIARNSSGDRSINSEALVKLLQQFREKDVVPKALLLAACFGIRRYDPFLHDPKLANLLSRANKEFAPWASFSTKTDKVFAVLRNVEWKEESVHTRCFGAIPEVWGLLLPAAASAPAELRSRSEEIRRLTGEWSTRAQFEALLGLSRASANRWIAQWLQQGLLEREGSGKNTRYRATEALIPKVEKMLAQSEALC